MVGKNDGINPFTRRVCQKKPSEISRAILWSMSAQKPTYWSRTLLPPFLDAKYQLLKLRHVQKAKFLKVFGVNSDTANLTLTFHGFSFRESFRKCRCQSNGTRSSRSSTFHGFFVFFLWSPWLKHAHACMVWKISSLCTRLMTKTDDITSNIRDMDCMDSYRSFGGKWVKTLNK